MKGTDSIIRTLLVGKPALQDIWLKKLHEDGEILAIDAKDGFSQELVYSPDPQILMSDRTNRKRQKKRESSMEKKRRNRKGRG
jgi:hypothetical protein